MLLKRYLNLEDTNDLLGRYRTVEKKQVAGSFAIKFTSAIPSELRRYSAIQKRQDVACRKAGTDNGEGPAGLDEVTRIGHWTVVMVQLLWYVATHSSSPLLRPLSQRAPSPQSTPSISLGT